MAKGSITTLRPSGPRYSPAIAAEGWMEVQAHLVTVRAFVAGDVTDQQRAHAALAAIDAEARRQAGWADSVACPDGRRGPAHGAAA